MEDNYQNDDQEIAETITEEQQTDVFSSSEPESDDEIQMKNDIPSKDLEFDDEEVEEKNVPLFNQIFQFIADIHESILFAIVFAVLLLTLIFRIGYVEGTSMMPTMKENDRYLLSDTFYTPKNGDIVVFAPDSSVDTTEPLWVKRVIATEGQEIYIDPYNNTVKVDGVVIEEPYLGSITTPRSTENPILVPKGYVFLMGDNRMGSRDSRDIGLVDVRRIVGHVLFKFF